MRITFIVCGFHLQKRIPRQLKFTKTDILLFVHGFHKLVPDSTHFVADSEKLPVFGAILSNTMFYLFVRGIQNSREDQRKIAILLIPGQF